MRFTVEAVTGLDEIREGDDMAALVAGACGLEDGDVLVLTSKVVSKAEGRVVRTDRRAAVTAETDRVVARREDTEIMRHHLGLVMAAAGVDASNTEPGTLVLLPTDPDATARDLRERLGELTGANVAVVLSDTSGRAWRLGQTDIAIGAAGLVPLDDHAGRTDPHGNTLAVTAPAIADEIAAAADLATQKTAGTPVAVLRGLAGSGLGPLVLPPGEHGPGAAALVRPETHDLFGLGTREAVHAAVTGDPSGQRGFGAPAPVEALTAVLRALLPGLGFRCGLLPVEDGLRVAISCEGERSAGRRELQVRALAAAHGWTVEVGAPAWPGHLDLTLRPLPAPEGQPEPEGPEEPVEPVPPVADQEVP